MRIFQLVKQQWLPITALIFAAITVMSLMPLPQLPEVPGSDKTHHLIAYASLMFPAFLVCHKARFYLLAGFLAWGGAIELVQPYVNRYGELLDLLANFSGLLLGWFLGWYIRKFV